MAVARALRSGCAQPAQEDSGRDFPARRGGRTERGGPVSASSAITICARSIAIPRPDGTADSAIDLDGFFGLHPSLAPLKPIYDRGQLAMVDAVGSPDPTRSHFDAQDYMESGTPGRKATAGRLAESRAASGRQIGKSRRCARLAWSADLPRALRGHNDAVAINNLNDFQVRDPRGGNSSKHVRGHAG